MENISLYSLKYLSALMDFLLFQNIKPYETEFCHVRHFQLTATAAPLLELNKTLFIIHTYSRLCTIIVQIKLCSSGNWITLLRNKGQLSSEDGINISFKM